MWSRELRLLIPQNSIISIAVYNTHYMREKGERADKNTTEMSTSQNLHAESVVLSCDSTLQAQGGRV